VVAAASARFAADPGLTETARPLFPIEPSLTVIEALSAL
jgi:hypothetical protein